MNEDEEIDMEMLAEKILDFLKLKLQWIASARHIWLIDIETGDVVTAFLELYDKQIVEEPLEVPRDSILLKLGISGESIARRGFLSSLPLVKRLSYGLDVETLEPKKILENPFFGLESLEEIALKLAVLGGWEGDIGRRV